MKICPVCDHALVGNLCPVCRQIVREPWTLNEGVYLNRSHSLPDDFCEFHDTHRDRRKLLLNERHPADETDCSYHDIHAGQHAAVQSFFRQTGIPAPKLPRNLNNKTR